MPGSYGWVAVIVPVQEHVFHHILVYYILVLHYLGPPKILLFYCPIRKSYKQLKGWQLAPVELFELIGVPPVKSLVL